jgi:hypothetical protein
MAGTAGGKMNEIRVDGYDIVRVLVGILLVTTASLKGYQLATGETLGRTWLDFRWLLIAVVELEWFLGLCLLAGVLKHRAWSVAFFCFAVFAVVSFYKWLSGETSCGCFGRLRVRPWRTFGLDLGILFSLLLWKPARTSRTHLRKEVYALLTVTAGWLVTEIPAAYAMSNRSLATMDRSSDLAVVNGMTLLRPETWVGEQFGLSEYIEIEEDLRQGKWFVLLYHHDCPRCQEVLPEVRRLASKDLPTDTFRICLIEMPPYGNGAREDLPANGRCAVGRLKDDREWFAETPVALFLRDGVVTDVRTRGKILSFLQDTE